MLVPGLDADGRYYHLRLQEQLRNERSVYDAPKQIFVLSDIEGNFKSLFLLLRNYKIIDKYLKWSFKDNHLVILGDCFDRGEEVMECLWLIYSLEERAQRDGGHVHFILGNHEIMNMNGDWRYIHPKYAITPSGSRHPATALYDGNSELWRWLRTKNIIEQIGDILFVHGGISEALLKLNLSVTEINELARPYYTRANELFTDPALHAILNSDESPFWYRGYYRAAVSEGQVDTILKKFDAKMIITGHTIVDKVTSFFNGKIINVDTNHAAGVSEALFIKGNNFYRVDKDGKRERLK
ncbi:hypothetical protein A4D02_10770 [Niastella koreensis]|uniref:Metallophosphoesterase n=3 Tax=Niastella koreensis TaxID=354356 RepID=G8T712_NIAKG|nr:metallophosphoesterase [Niastella koreensis GR20-10]OQP43950.1 hypothetical protein A4D02_10770 [Niastella koreensis]